MDFFNGKGPLVGRFLEEINQGSQELFTTLTEIEAVLNARPITYIYKDEESISYPVTPSHLVNGRSMNQFHAKRRTFRDRQYQRRVDKTSQASTKSPSTIYASIAERIHTFSDCEKLQLASRTE